MLINTPNDSTTYQHAQSHADYIEISVYVLMKVCLDPIIYFPMIYANIWSFFLDKLPVSIYTFIIHGQVQASDIYILLTYVISHQVLFLPIMYQYHVHPSFPYTNPIFCPYMVFESKHNIRN